MMPGGAIQSLLRPNLLANITGVRTVLYKVKSHEFSIEKIATDEIK